MKFYLILLILFPITSFSQTGPGGVGTVDGSSSLEGWYKGSQGIEEAPGDDAEIGDLVITWIDQSGNGNDMTLLAGDASPFLVNSLGFDCLEFTTTVGADRRLVANSPTGASVTDVSIFSVFSTNSANSNERPVGIVTDPAWVLGFGDNFSQAAENSIRKDNGAFGGSVAGVINQKRVRSSLMKPGEVDDFVDGAQNISSAASFTTQATTLFRIGHLRRKDNTPRVYETMYFSTKVNDAQRIIIDNYLSAKYGTTMTAFDVFDEDDAGNGDYDNEVAGIGRVDASNIHNDAQGESIVRVLNPIDLNDDEFLMWGHDNGSLTLTASNTPSEVDNRLNRIWRVSEMSSLQVTVDVGCIDIRFDLTGLGVFNATDLVILIDSDNDGLFSDEIPVSGATNLGANIFEFSNMGFLSDNNLFTLGILDPSIVSPIVRTGCPVLPVTIANFDIICKSNNVTLTWTTASEINNDYFTIERSNDAINFEPIGTVNGNGNSSTKINYTWLDDNPINGAAYYRLKQTDFNGEFNYHGIRSATCKQLNKMTIYPNPFDNSFTVQLSENVTYPLTVEVYDYLGRKVYSQTIETKTTEIALDELIIGTYFVKVFNETTQVVERIVKVR